MRKITSLLTLLLLLVGTCAWAQTEVTVPQASTASAKYTYKMHCAATDHGGNYINVTEGTVDGRNEEGTLLEFVSTGNENEWYIKDAASKKYLVVSSTANGTLVTLSETADCYWKQDGTFFKANGVASANLNNNGALAVRGGTGGCSQWTLLEYVEEAQPLSWSEVKDGYTYALVNVQPASVGHNYYLNSTDGNLTPVDATGFTSISEWPTTAQFVAEKQADGKFAFKNVANGQYLAWKSHNGGENGMKGFVDTIEQWSAWTLNASGRGAGFEGTYWLSCAKRASATNGVGTLLIANNGSWNAANTEWTTSAYSNTYGFVELAAPTMPLVEFNYVLCFEGFTKNIPVSGRVGQPLPAVTIPNIFNGEQPTGTIAPNQESIDIVLTLKEGIMPFQYFEQSSAITQWYTLKMRDNYWMKYSATGDPFPLSTTAPATNDNTRLFGFVGNPLHGFKIVSYADGFDYRYVGATTGNNSTCTAIDNEADATTLLFEVNSGHNVFHVDGNAYLNAIASSTKLGVWNHTSAATDGGSTFTFAEADVASFNLDELKAEAIAALPSNIPALYTAEDIATATAAINAVTCSSDEESIRAAKEAIAAAKVALLKTAEGKKIAFKSMASYSTRDANYFLLSENAGTQMTASTDLTMYGVYQLTFNEDALAYTVQAIKNETYLPKTGNPSTAIATTDDIAAAGLYTFTATNEEDRVILTNTNGQGISDSQGGIHLDGSKKIVVWGPTGAASQWNIIPISDEVWEVLTYEPEGCDWTAYETLLNQVNQYTFGDKLGQYADALIPGYEDPTPITSMLGYYAADLSTQDDTYYTQDMEEMQWILDNLQLNMPQDGQFFRIKASKTWIDTPTYLKGTQNANNKAEFTQNNDETTGAETIFCYYFEGAGKYLVNYGNGMTAANNSNFMGMKQYPSTTAIAFQAATTGEKIGKYNIKFAGSRFLYTNKGLYADAGNGSTAEGYNFELEQVDAIPVSISAAGNATLYAPAALQIPDGVTAYALTDQGTYLHAEPIDGTIPANTGVIICGEEGTYNFQLTTGGNATSCLSGVVPTKAKSGAVYTLANGNDGLGFYNYTGQTTKGFHAFYQAPAEGRSLKVVFGDETGIVNVNDNDNANSKIYDLAGRKLNSMQKGIYIINGKKVLK